MKKALQKITVVFLMIMAPMVSKLDAQCPGDYDVWPAFTWYSQDLQRYVTVCPAGFGFDYCCTPGGPQEQ